MYLSDRDLEYAVQTGQLIVDPPPTAYDSTSIDLHLDSTDKARVWDAAAFEQKQKEAGVDPAVVRLGSFAYQVFSVEYTRPVPADRTALVHRVGDEIIVRPQGFLLWQTREKVGTPETNAQLICFIDGKSTQARTGILVHMTAPTIHAGWWGNVTLEIANLGPFNLALAAGDPIAQIVVARITSLPLKKKKAIGIAVGQADVTGA
jgi:dCTP deaminase